MNDPFDATGFANADAFYWPVLSANYNVMALVDDAGLIAERYEYTPYGERQIYRSAGPHDLWAMSPVGESPRWQWDLGGGLVFTWNHSLNPVGHQGKMHDEVTGLIHYTYRYLHPRLGRFIQRDPAGYVDGPNLYQYVRSNPLNWVDPEGTKAFRLDIVAKSFIAPIGGHIGHVPGGRPRVLAALARARDVFYWEDPRTDDKWGREYRLYSREDVTFECCGDEIDPVATFKRRDSRVGSEPVIERVRTSQG